MKKMFLRLVKGVRIRREPFGGLVYEPNSGTTVELDHGAYRFVELASKGISLGNAHKAIVAEGIEKGLARNDVIEVTRALYEQRIIEPCDSTSEYDQPREKVDFLSWPSCSSLSAPETVHWAVTYRCIADCPDCYAARYRTDSKTELPTNRAKEVIDRIASWGAFQLAIGGGEPLLRRDLADLVCHAAGKGLAVHLTSGGDFLSPSLLGSLAGSLTCLQVGVRHQDLFSRIERGQVERLSRIVDEVGRHSSLHIGANLVLCRTVLARFEEAVELILEAGFRRLVLLRYKPPSSLGQWKKEAPDAHELFGMERRIEGIQTRYPGVEIRLDCALSFLERNLAPETAYKVGIRGCVAGARIVTIGPDGSVYPCSQLVDPRFLAGNIIDHEPERIWTRSVVLSRLRRFRRAGSFRRSACGACSAAEHCGGCRVFTHDGYGPDPGCPGPVLVRSDELLPETGG